jgi:2-oxoglutarate ferredoxin oxidoreductase subunit beta
MPCAATSILTYIVMDNQIYGLTTGQASPTTMKDARTKSTPQGNVESPLNPLALAPSSPAPPTWRAASPASPTTWPT